MRRLSLAGIGLAVLLLAALGISTQLRSSFLPIDLGHYLAAGKLLLAGEDPYPRVEFFFPPWSILLLGPLAVLPVPAAGFLWLILAVGSQAYSAASSFRWLARPATWPAGPVLIILAAMMPAALFAYVTGQISPIVGAAALMGLWQAAQPDPHPASVALALAVTSLKPHIVSVAILICLLELAVRRRWPHLLWIAALGVVLVAVGFLALPTWIPSLASALRGGAFLGGPAFVAPGFRGLREFGVPLWLLLPFFIYPFIVWKRERLSARTAALALSAGLLIAPYTRAYDQVLLAFPAAIAALRHGDGRTLRTGLAALAVFILPWTPAWPLAPALIVLSLVLIPGTPSDRTDVQAGGSPSLTEAGLPMRAGASEMDARVVSGERSGSPAGNRDRSD